MAVVSRVATLRIDDTATHTTNALSWVATAATQDTAAGGSVIITIVRSVVGVPPADPNTLTLSAYNDDGGLVRAFTLNPTAASQTATLHFTNDGTSAGTARAGTLELAIRATRTDVGTYDVETDGSPNSTPAGFDSHLDRGWVRATTTAASVISNVSLGGAKASPAAYDESLFVRSTLGAALYVSRGFTVAVSGATPALSASTNSATTGNFDATFATVVDDRFPAAVTTAATSLTVPNATLTGQPFTVLTTTNDSINVDPRLTATHHFQVDDNSFALAANVASRQMLSTSSGFLAVRLTNARGAGVNGATVAQTLTPVTPGAAISNSTTTSAKDGQDGWSGFLDWTASKPGGAWNKTTDVTAPTDIDNDAHLLAGTETLTMLAPDPNVIGWPYLSVPGNEAGHVRAGDTLCVTLIVTHHATGKRVLNVTDGTCALVRFDAGRYEYLDADAATWVEWTSTNVLVTHPLSETTPGAGLWNKEFALTSGWGAVDLLGVMCAWKVGGTPYQASVPREFVGDANSHSGYAVDPIGLGLAGIISTR